MTGVRKAFGATQALAGVDFTVQPGEVHALIGENGAGKSTLMKVLSGVHRPDAGRIELDGQPYAPETPLDARQRGVAMIYQELALAPQLSVAANILLGMEPARRGWLDHATARRMAADALDALGHPDIAPGAAVRSLGAGARQLVEIARALVLRARVVILDEPTSSLARGDVDRLFDVIRKLCGQGVSVVYISHFLEEVERIADSFTVLRDGKSAGSGKAAGATRREIIQLMVGRELNEMFPRVPREPGEPLLEIEGLAAAAGVSSATLTLRRGEILGVAGLIGAGRTEMMRAIFGLDPVVRGQVRIGVYASPATPGDRWAQRVGMVSEDRKSEGLAMNLSIADNLTLPRLKSLVTPAGQDRTSARWIERLAIRCASPRQRTLALSGGNQQKVALARLLHADVDVLLLDEPTRGIDVGSKAQIYELIDELARGDAASGRPPRAVLMISSYLPELLGVCDRVAVMHRGELGEARPVEELDEHTIMLEATGAGGRV